MIELGLEGDDTPVKARDPVLKILNGGVLRGEGLLEVSDGGKVIYQEPVSLEYMVIMTPGADRWLVRDLQASTGAKP